MKNNNVLEEVKQHGDYHLPIGIYHGEVNEQSDGYTHWHKQIEISYISSGEGKSSADNIISYVEEGDIILINKESVHFMKSDTSMIVDTVVFDIEFLCSSTHDYNQVNFFNLLIDKKLKMVPRIKPGRPQYEEIRNIVKRIIESATKKELGYTLEVKGLLLILFSILYNQNYIFKIEEKGAKAVQKQIAIRNVLNFIEENYNKEITTEKLAKIAGYSEYHFIRFFKEQTGRTCKDYVNSIRLEKAANLLLDTSLSITDITFAVGYNDLSYFIKVFRKKYGIPPHRYRRTKEKE